MGNMGSAINILAGTAAVLLLIFIPLGLWKAIEITIYIFSHLHWS